MVGIFGEWGAGKSKLLSLIQTEAIKYSDERIENHKKYNGYAPLAVQVFFQPWKYEHKEHLLVPMLLHILVALEETLKKAKTLDDKLIGTVHKGVDAAVAGIGGLLGAAKKVLGVADPSSAAALATAEALAGKLPKERRKIAQANQYSFKDDGRAYYDMHRILAKITRPGKYPEVAGNNFQDKDFAVNFVLFIDDLDRCLPEKAVTTLELIKTIFNLESFAFVLALDEEVVERGIGHRYRDYALAIDPAR